MAAFHIICRFAAALRSFYNLRFSCVAFKLLGKCCRPRRVGTERERMSGQMRRAENVNAIHWGNQKQRQRQVQVKTVPKICQCSVALGHAICKGFPSGQCCLCLAATPRSRSTRLPTLRPKLMPLVKFSQWLPIAENEARRKGGARGGWQATSCQVISINVEAVKCSKSIKRRPNTRNKRSRL